MILATQKLGPKLTKILVGFLLVTLAVTGLTLLASWYLEGAAAAINDAGSLRMRSYRIAYLLAHSKPTGVAPEVLRKEIDAEIRAFEETLAGLRQGDPARPLFLPANRAIRSEMQRIEAGWREEVKPLITRILDSRDPIESRELFASYQRVVENYVVRIDGLVQGVERDNARNTALLRSYQLTLLGVVLIGVVGLICLMYLLVVRPVGKLQQGIQHMAEGDFDAVVPVESRDEFGALAVGFNHMAEHLKTLYGTLEQRVQAKTCKLEEKNRELGVLYEITTLLNEPLPQEDLCRGFARKLIQFTGADGAAVRLLDRGSDSIHLYVGEGLSEEFVRDEQCLSVGECLCGEAAQTKLPVVRFLKPRRMPAADLNCEKAGYGTVSVFTIQVKKKLLGVFNLYFRRVRALDRQQQQLLETLGQHLGAALENQRLLARDRELAVSEERNLLAQELHDSIAQSLAFLNIQAQLLQDSLQRGDSAEATEGVSRIREGVQECYDDVRELLVHFRTKLNHEDIELALRSILERFEGQTGIRTSFAHSGSGIPLSPEDELQVLHIVQEALSNVRKHARASRVEVTMHRDRAYDFRIRDDGAGFDPAKIQDRTESHVGLKIMRERAHRVGGKLEVVSAPGRGTEVALTLPVAQREAA